MKKLAVAAVSTLMAGMSLVSCRNDDDSSKSSSIIGKWNFSTQKITSNGFLVSEGPYDGNEAGCNADYLSFFEDHTAVTGDYDENCELELISSNYTRDGNDLTLSYGPVTSTDFRIMTANATTLVLKNTYQNDGTTFVKEVKYLKAP